jgi:head-tail adaptor
MAICKKIKRTDNRITIGALDTLIKLKIRTLTPPTGSSVDYGETFTDWIDVWALVTTVNGVVFFDESTNLERTVTHKIYIRYIPDVTSETWVLLPAQFGAVKDQYLDILRVDNLNEKNKFYMLTCALRGDVTKKVNWM